MDRDQLTEHLKFAAELGVAGVSRDPRWRDREMGTGVFPGDIKMGTGQFPDGNTPVPIFASAADALAAVRTDIGDCTRCKLHAQGRKQIVFGVGNPEADLMFVGEAPGGDEDLQGIPFVGRAGQLLTKIIEAIGLKRDDVYIANVIKCRPPDNRDPELDEVETCKPFLLQQIELIKPKVVCTLGRWATETLLGRKVGITKIRGHAIRHTDFVIFPMLHPAAALHQGGLMEPLREDFQKLQAFLLQPAVETAPTGPSPLTPPSEPHQAPAQQTQMDLFGS